MNTSGIQLTLNGLVKHEAEIIDVDIALKEFDKLKDDISFMYDIYANITKIQLDYKQQLFKIFPNLKNELRLLKSHLTSLQNNIIKAQDNTKKILSRKINFVNETIEKNRYSL